ncbi:hypothetical protein PGK08_014645 [Acinetobacter baumannii]|nr:hypothetical protein [Acinetobacter baumannii]MDQ9841220.1 hypothetical protein [Acinetobacter baumannii]
MNLKQWQRSKEIKAEAEAAAKRTVERVLNAVKEPAMSEFKVGDWVKRTDKITESIYQISSIDKDLIKCNFIKNGENWRLHTTKGEIEYATPEEIAAGHRIDNDLGDDFPIENRISPHCQSKDV